MNSTNRSKSKNFVPASSVEGSVTSKNKDIRGSVVSKSGRKTQVVFDDQTPLEGARDNSKDDKRKESG
jgi:hypothetical protein